MITDSSIAWLIARGLRRAGHHLSAQAWARRARDLEARGR